MGGKVFGQMLHMDSFTATIVFVAVVFALLGLETAIERLEHASKHYGYEQLFNKVSKEMMLLGVISFTTFVLFQTVEVNSHSPWLVSFNFAHIVVLFIALAYVVQASVLTKFVFGQKKRLYSYANLSESDLLKCYDELSKRTDQMMYWVFHKAPLWLPFPVLRDQFEYKIIEHHFIQTFALPTQFNFAEYMTRRFKSHVITLVDVQPISWFILSLVVVLNFARIKAIDPSFQESVCHNFSDDRHDDHHDDHHDDGVHRFLSEAVAVGCPQYFQRIALVYVMILTAYIFTVFLVSNVYLQRYLEIAVRKLRMPVQCRCEQHVPFVQNEAEDYHSLPSRRDYKLCLLNLQAVNQRNKEISAYRILQMLSEKEAKKRAIQEYELEEIRRSEQFEDPFDLPIVETPANGNVQLQLPTNLGHAAAPPDTKRHSSFVNHQGAHPGRPSQTGQKRHVRKTGAQFSNPVRKRTSSNTAPKKFRFFDEDIYTPIHTDEPEHSTSLMGRLRGVSEAIGLTSLHSTEMPDFDASSKDPGRARRTYSGVFHSAEKEDLSKYSYLGHHTRMGNDHSLQNFHEEIQKKKKTEDEHKEKQKDLHSAMLGELELLSSPKSASGEEVVSGSAGRRRSVTSDQGGQLPVNVKEESTKTIERHHTLTNGIKPDENTTSQFSGNRFSSSVSLLAGGQHQNSLKTVHDYRYIYFWDNPRMYQLSVESTLLLQCFYVSLWISNLIVLGTEYINETHGDEKAINIAWTVILSLPIVLNFFMLRDILYLSCTLQAVSVLNLEDSGAICQERLESEQLVEKFRSLLRNKLYELGVPKASRRTFLQEELDALDADEHGYIDFPQFQELLLSLSIHISLETCKQMFRSLETDVTGYVLLHTVFEVCFPEVAFAEADTDRRSPVKKKLTKSSSMKYLGELVGGLSSKHLDPEGPPHNAHASTSYWGFLWSPRQFSFSPRRKNRMKNEVEMVVDGQAFGADGEFEFAVDLSATNVRPLPNAVAKLSSYTEQQLRAPVRTSFCENDSDDDEDELEVDHIV